MKRSERLMFLAGFLCAACAVTFGVVRTKEQKEKKEVISNVTSKES